MLFGVADCEVYTGDDRTIRAGAFLVEDFDAEEECALGDAKVGTTNRTSAVGTVWKECGSLA